MASNSKPKPRKTKTSHAFPWLERPDFDKRIADFKAKLALEDKSTADGDCKPWQGVPLKLPLDAGTRASQLHSKHLTVEREKGREIDPFSQITVEEDRHFRRVLSRYHRLSRQRQQLSRLTASELVEMIDAIEYDNARNEHFKNIQINAYHAALKEAAETILARTEKPDIELLLKIYRLHVFEKLGYDLIAKRLNNERRFKPPRKSPEGFTPNSIGKLVRRWMQSEK